MKFSIWDLLTHLGDVEREAMDIRNLVIDLIKKQPAGADAAQALADLGKLLTDGVIPLPANVTVDQILAVIQGLLPAATAAVAQAAAPSS